MPDLEKIGGTHDGAAEARRLLGKQWYDAAFSVAFVRNPWDRLVSWYTMIAESQRDLKLHHYVHAHSHDFESFLRKCTATIKDHDGKKSLIKNQIDYLTNWRRRQIVDFIGHFETIEADLATVMERLGLPEKPLPKVNATKHHHYSAYYTDETAELVRRRFARDIAAFGFSFERVLSPCELDSGWPTYRMISDKPAILG